MNKLIQMGANYGANALGIQDNPAVKLGLMALDPIGSAVKALAPQVDSALGAAPGTTSLALSPKGFAKDLAKDTIKESVKDREEIPEEDRSISSSGGGGKAYTDDELSSGSAAFKRGGKIKSTAKSSTASRRGDGIAQRGKTRGRML